MGSLPRPPLCQNLHVLPRKIMVLELPFSFQTSFVSTLRRWLFLLFRSLDHVPLFLKYLNRQHPNISFTSELEKDGKIFSRCWITRLNGKISTSIYRKPTFTGLFTNFHSYISLAYKRFLVFCLLNRIFNICSSYENFHIQLEVVRKLFNLNGFPSHMFDHLVRRFLNNIFEPKPTIHTVPKKIIYFCLPFTDSHSLQIRTQITRLCNAAYPYLNIQFVFRSSTRISSFFHFKDKASKFLRSGVVYLFKCRCCSASYVSQTTRHLHTRTLRNHSYNRKTVIQSSYV